MNRMIRTALLAMTLGMLCGCDNLASNYAKELVVNAFSYSGWSTMTVKGQLPANFGIGVVAYYGPDDPTRSSCRAATFTPGETVTRQHGQRYTATIKEQPQAFTFDIPLSYYEGLCGMKLGRLLLKTRTRYGEADWQETHAEADIYMVASPKTAVSRFDPSGTLNINSECRFDFQERHMYPSLLKTMSCRNIGTFLSRENLSGKSIDLMITVSPEEEPAKRDTWVKFNNGWKPCLPREGFQRCQVPPLYKTFQMNGRTCTIYPGCTE